MIVRINSLRNCWSILPGSRLAVPAALATALLSTSASAGWFSSDYNCENKDVVTKVEEMIACEALIKCKVFGLDYDQARSLSSEQITAKVEPLLDIDIANATRGLNNPAAISFVRRNQAALMHSERDVVLTFRTLFHDERTWTDEHIENISKYRCRLTFTFDPSVYVPFWTVIFRTAFAKDKNNLFVAIDMEGKNPGLDYFGNLVAAAMQQQNVVAKSRSPETKTAMFIVQPSNGIFAVEIENADKLIPGVE